MKQIKKYIFSIFILLTTFCFSQNDESITFKANVSKEKLALNERLRIDFTMNKDGDNFTPPSFNGFRVLMGPNQSISNSWVNGKRSYSKTYSYVLSPTARGKFSIKQATVQINNKTYKTLPVTIEVGASVDKPSDEKSADNITDDNLHLVAEISNSKPYLNEAVNVVYKLYVGSSIRVSNYKALDNPKYNNFWSQDIEVKHIKIETGNYKGKPYQYVVLKRVVLYPQKTGKLNIEPLSLEVTVDVPTNRRDIFGGTFYTQTHKTIAAGTRTINVKPLPEKGKPEGFTGAVGKFDFNVIPSKTDLKATESLTVKVEVNGKGNLKLFDLPKLNVPSSLEVYDPESDQQVNTNLSGMRGKVSDSYTIVPQYRGKYPIPATSFSFFDPSEKKYKTLSSQEILINVFEGPANTGEKTTNSPIVGNYKQPVTAIGSQFQFIKLKANLKPKITKDFFGSKLFYILLLGPLLLIPLFVIIGKKKRAVQSDVEGNRIRKANRLAKKYLSEAKKALGKKEIFYEAMERALHNYLKAKLKIETSDLSKDKIQTLLLSKNVTESSVNDYISLLNSCELARYTPTSEVEIQDDYNKAAEVISQIDKQIKL